mmetsp:Transcript_8921/g.21457  ORF Transcript_8921/g.21457 Transcript_8921/m.21457 type:complete len:282 (-) Transcript_8921:122-967(-)
MAHGGPVHDGRERRGGAHGLLRANALSLSAAQLGALAPAPVRLCLRLEDTRVLTPPVSAQAGSAKRKKGGFNLAGGLSLLQGEVERNFAQLFGHKKKAQEKVPEEKVQPTAARQPAAATAYPPTAGELLAVGGGASGGPEAAGVEPVAEAQLPSPALVRARVRRPYVLHAQLLQPQPQRLGPAPVRARMLFGLRAFDGEAQLQDGDGAGECAGAEWTGERVLVVELGGGESRPVAVAVALCFTRAGAYELSARLLLESAGLSAAAAVLVHEVLRVEVGPEY